MESKKIILLASSDINYDQRLQKIASSLMKFKKNVLLLGRKKQGAEALQVQKYQQDRVQCLINRGILFYLELNFRLFFRVLGKKVDVVCANDPDTLLAALLIKWFSRADLIYDAHEYFIEVPELSGRVIKQKIWSGIERFGVNHAIKCYTVNESLAKLFGEKFGKPFSVVKNVPLASKHAIAANKSDFILYQGALNRGRGLESLLVAMLQVDAHLVIVGKGDIESELHQLVQSLHLQDKVSFKGYVFPAELKHLTASAYIGVNLLEGSSLNYHYSLANKFFDYMHAGVPSINMNFPEYAKIHKEAATGILIEDLNPEELGSAINTLFEDKQLYSKFRSNCEQLSKRYNWEEEEKILINIYT